jgi:excisionase family DNA binding protein
MDDDKLLSNDEAAEYLGIKPNTLTIWRTTKRFEIPYIQIGRKIKYKKSDLDKFLNENIK